MSTFTESVVEDAALAWLMSRGYTVMHSPDIAAGDRFDPLPYLQDQWSWMLQRCC
jgi:hypothetical protein